MENSDFTREKIKVKPVNKDKILHKSIITLILAVVFGLVSCLTFLLLEPVISNILYPKNISGKVVTLPEEEQEMLPEDMVSDRIYEEVTFGPKNEVNVSLTDQQLENIIKGISLDFTDYQNMYESMSEYMNYMKQYTVEVVGVQSEMDWFYNVNEEKNRTSGVIIGKNEESFFILTDYNTIKEADSQEVIFYDGKRASAKIYNSHEGSNLAILQVYNKNISNKELGIDYKVVSFGSSNNNKLRGTLAVAIGSPLGTYDSVGFGIITSINTTYHVMDMNYQLLNTDINGSSNGSGALFDLNGRFIGLIVPSNEEGANTVTAYGVNDVKRIANHMLKESDFPYFGIIGVDVSDEANQEYKVPYGIYVEDIAMNSPAMLSGIQKGDIIVSLDDKEVKDMGTFTNYILKKDGTITVKLKRQSFGSYSDMTVNVTLQRLK